MMKNAKQIAVAALALCALCTAAAAAPPAGSPVDKNGQLSVKNGQIVNKNNDPVALRGMSFFWSNPGWEGAKYYNSNVVGWLADDWKVDIVRAAMNPTDRGDWQKVVDAAIDKGIYVIIDWHSHNAHNQTNDAKTFFSTQAGKYKDTPNVLYEIYNEPCPTKDGGACAGDDWATLVRPYAQAVVDEIRKTDTKNIIVIGSADYSKRVDLATVNPVSGSNLAYSVHYYTAEPGTNHQDDLRGWCNTALGRGHALLVTEFGLSEADGGDKTAKKCPDWIKIPECPNGSNGTYNNTNKIDTTEANVWFSYLDQRYIGWVNWSIVDKNEAASALAGNAASGGNWSEGNLRASGKFIRNKLRLYAENRTITIDKKGDGTVTVSPAGSTAGSVTTVRYGTPVTITATPASGWMFEGWSGGVSGVAATRSLPPLYSNISVTANFAEGSMIKNGTFTNDLSSWGYNGVTIDRDPADGGSLKATVPSGGGATYRVQQTGIKIEAGKQYKLSFKAKTSGSAPRNITARLTNTNRNKNYMPDTAAVTLGAAWPAQPFERTFTATESDDNAVLLFACGGHPNDAWEWWLDDVKLNLVGSTPVTFNPAAPALSARTAWSISKTGGALQLRGPVEAGARVSLYDTRGKAVKSMAAKDGLILNANGVPAGSYFVVVKNRAGADVYKSRVSFVR